MIKSVIVHEVIQEIKSLSPVTLSSVKPYALGQAIFIYVMHILLFSGHPPTKVGLSNHGNWFCLIRVSSLWLSVRFNRFSRGWRVADPAVVSLCGNISTFGLPSPMNVYSLRCWGNDAVTSVKRKALWQLPLRIQREDPVWEPAWHCVRGAACATRCTHLCRGRPWGSDDATDDAFQCDPVKSTQGQM